MNCVFSIGNNLSFFCRNYYKSIITSFFIWINGFICWCFVLNGFFLFFFNFYRKIIFFFRCFFYYIPIIIFSFSRFLCWYFFYFCRVRCNFWFILWFLIRTLWILILFKILFAVIHFFLFWFRYFRIYFLSRLNVFVWFCSNLFNFLFGLFCIFNNLFFF